jgi:hypothetical protein
MPPTVLHRARLKHFVDLAMIELLSKIASWLFRPERLGQAAPVPAPKLSQSRFLTVYYGERVLAKSTASEHHLNVVGDRTHSKWAYLVCPCGCGETLELNLMKSHWPHWKLRVDRTDSPTLQPSVWSQTCGAHFWLRDGVITWCLPTSGLGTDPRRRDPSHRSPSRSIPPGARGGWS